MSMNLHDGLQSPGITLTEMPTGSIGPGGSVSAGDGEMPSGRMETGEMPAQTISAAASQLTEMPAGAMEPQAGAGNMESVSSSGGGMPAGMMNGAGADPMTGAGPSGEMPSMSAAVESGAAGNVIQLSGKWQLTLNIES